ncbi:MAG: fimbrillin family protein [Alistipes sp.]|nr:fimbrillin family protein [Alistipes sp.]
MKRFFQSLVALAFVVSMQGCGSSPSVEPEIPDTPTQSAVQLHLTGNIAAITPSTRVNADGFVANDKVGVYVAATNTLASSGNMLNNEAFTYSSGNLTAPAGKEVYWGTEETRLNVWAYYPYIESVENNAAYPFVVHANQVRESNFYNSDFITARATNLAPQTTPVNLTFNHSLSRINVTLTAGEGITNDELAAAEKNLYISGMVTSGTIDLATGVATADATKSDIMPYVVDGRSYSAIVYPRQGSVTFRLEMNGEVFTYTTDVDFAAAKQYEYTLSINVSEPQQMTLTTTTINPWGEGEDYSGVMSNIISFTDTKLKEFLLRSNLDAYDADREGTYEQRFYDTGNKIDANNDGEISLAEAEKVVYIRLANVGVESLADLKYFPNLLRLVYQGEIETIDLSQNTKLRWLWLSDSQLASLDLSMHKDLEHLQIGGAPLISSLDLSNNSALTILYIEMTNISSLDLRYNTALQKVYCSYNKLTTLNVSENYALKYINCINNQLITLDLTKCTALESLNCYANKLTSLELSKNLALTNLSCGNNELTTLDVSKNTALQSFTCYSNLLTSLDVTKNTELEVLQCQNNNLTSLDVTKNTKLDRLWFGEQDITSIDVSKNTMLTDLYCLQAKLTHLDVSANLLLEELNCGINELTELDISNNTKLNYLYCSDNYLTSLDISNNLYLQTLQCSSMRKSDGTFGYLPILYISEGQMIDQFDLNENTVIEYK